MSIQPGTPPQTPAKAQVAFGYPLDGNTAKAIQAHTLNAIT